MVKMTTRESRLKAKNNESVQIAKLIHQRLKAVKKYVAAIAADGHLDVENVHHLRTETRRAGVTTRMLQGWLPHHRCRHIQKLLHSLRRQAGSVRDLDVQFPLFDSLLPQLTPDARNWLQYYAAESRKKNARALKRVCRKQIVKGFPDAIQSLCRRVRWRHTEQTPSARSVVNHESQGIVTQFRQAIESLKADVANLHEVRKNGRRLRYALEHTNNFNPNSQTDPICRRLSELQDSLGTVHDRQLLVNLIRESIRHCEQPEIQQILAQSAAALEAETVRAITETARITLEEFRNLDVLLQEFEAHR